MSLTCAPLSLEHFHLCLAPAMRPFSEALSHVSQMSFADALCPPAWRGVSLQRSPPEECGQAPVTAATFLDWIVVLASLDLPTGKHFLLGFLGV